MKNAIRFAMLVVFAALVGLATRAALQAAPDAQPFIRTIDMSSFSAEPTTVETEPVIEVAPTVITHRRAPKAVQTPCVIDWRPLEQGRGMVRTTGVCR